MPNRNPASIPIVMRVFGDEARRAVGSRADTWRGAVSMRYTREPLETSA
jgi:hypothetical protein